MPPICLAQPSLKFFQDAPMCREIIKATDSYP